MAARKKRAVKKSPEQTPFLKAHDSIVATLNFKSSAQPKAMMANIKLWTDHVIKELSTFEVDKVDLTLSTNYDQMNRIRNLIVKLRTQGDANRKLLRAPHIAKAAAIDEDYKNLLNSKIKPHETIVTDLIAAENERLASIEAARLAAEAERMARLDELLDEIKSIGMAQRPIDTITHCEDLLEWIREDLLDLSPYEDRANEASALLNAKRLLVEERLQDLKRRQAQREESEQLEAKLAEQRRELASLQEQTVTAKQDIAPTPPTPEPEPVGLPAPVETPPVQPTVRTFKPNRMHKLNCALDNFMESQTELLDEIERLGGSDLRHELTLKSESLNKSIGDAIELIGQNNNG